jgi:hypothetical protein
MVKSCEDCLGFNEAFRYYRIYREFPLYIPDYIKSEIKQLKHGENSDIYIKERIRVYKFLYCKLADSRILRAYSRNFSLVVSSEVPEDVENEV